MLSLKALIFSKKDNMTVEVLKDYHSLSERAAGLLIEQIKKKKDSVLCFASGDTPRLTLQMMVEKAKAEAVNYSEIQFIGLDEWVGISPETSGSCSSFFYETFLSPLQVPKENIHLFDAMAADLQGECFKMDRIIGELGGIDVMVVGIGVNGHIGFNEPNTPWNLQSHVAQLHEITRTVGQKYFEGSTDLTEGITLGFQHLLDARNLLLMASGTGKSGIVKAALTEPCSEKIPASVVRRHVQSLILLDAHAASSLSPQAPAVE